MFYFDQMGEDLFFGAVDARIEMALVKSGVYLIGLQLREGTRVAHGRTVPDDPVEAERQRQRRESDKAAGRAVGKYASHSDLEDLLGENNLAALSKGLPPIDVKVKAFYIQRSKATKLIAEKLATELAKIRSHFYPDYDIADFRDGPREYVDEIQSCVDQLFPPPSIKALIDLVRKSRRKLAMLLAGSASAADQHEIADYVRYFDWFCDRFDLLDAPSPPDLPLTRAREIRDYLRALQAYLEKIASQKLPHDTVLSKYLSEMETVKSTDQSTMSDGPIPPNVFRYGNKVEILQPLPWRLLNYIWKTRASKEQDAIDAAWGHDASLQSDAIKSAIKKINRALDKTSCPLHAGQKNGFINLS